MESVYEYKLYTHQLRCCGGTNILHGEIKQVQDVKSCITVRTIEFMVTAITENLFNVTKREIFCEARETICSLLRQLANNIKLIDLKKVHPHIGVVQIATSAITDDPLDDWVKWDLLTMTRIPDVNPAKIVELIKIAVQGFFLDLKCMIRHQTGNCPMDVQLETNKLHQCEQELLGILDQMIVQVNRYPYLYLWDCKIRKETVTVTLTISGSDLRPWNLLQQNDE